MTHLEVRKALKVCVRIAKYRAMIHVSQYPMWELPRQGIPLCEFQLQSEELCSTREPILLQRLAVKRNEQIKNFFDMTLQNSRVENKGSFSQ